VKEAEANSQARISASWHQAIYNMAASSGKLSVNQSRNENGVGFAA
jgi:hypothetical protein